MFGNNEIVGRSHFKDVPPETLMVTSMFFTLQGEGPFGGLPALFIRLTKCNLACSFCFVPCTEVTLSDLSKKRIDQVTVGDEVWSYNEQAGLFQFKKVTKVYRSLCTELVRVITDLGKVHCTPDHPFLTTDGIWVSAKDLTHNMCIEAFSTEYGPHARKVLSVHHLTDAEVLTYNTSSEDLEVFNLEIEDNHTYVANNMVVHNCDTFFDQGELLTYKTLEIKAYETICDWFNTRSMAVPLWLLDTDNTGQSTIPGGGKFNCVLVITGGEPLLQPNLAGFLQQQVHNFAEVQIESNGIISQKLDPKVTLVCSPKCFEKDGKAVRYLEPSKDMLARADCLKFVMSSDPDSPYSKVPDWAHKWRDATRLPVFVSPMNVYHDIPHQAKLLRATKSEITMAERSTIDEVVSFWTPGLLNMVANQANHEYAARYCMKHGFRLNLQVHLLASLA